jgi:hypothetical protein
MITVMVPIGVFPFFVYANVENVMETCGVPESEIDFVYLTHNHIPDNLQRAFDEMSKRRTFRVIQAPFDSQFDQLRLLDWAFHYADISDWVVVEHCDLFWHPFHNQKPWLVQIKEAIAANPEAKILSYGDGGGHHFKMKDGDGFRPVFKTGDSHLVVNRSWFVKTGLMFRWGNVNKLFGPPLSPEVMKSVQEGVLQWHEGGRGNPGGPIDPEGFALDGGEAIALEMAVRFPELLVEMPQLSDQLVHFWFFFRLTNYTNRSGATLNLGFNFRKKLPYLVRYSLVTSHLFEREDLGNYAIPFGVVKRIAELNGWKLEGEAWARDIVEKLNRYYSPKNPIGEEDCCGIKLVLTPQQSFDLFKI